MEKRATRENRLWTGNTLVALLLVASFALIPTNADASTFQDVDCTPCHGSGLKDIHHAVANSQGLICTTCHLMQWDPKLKVYVVLTDLNCTNCHDGANHESSHDMAFFSPEPAASQLCMSCHQQMVAEHLSRELSCTTCHNNTDPKIMDTIYRGQNGEAVYCLDCHYQVQLSYGIHNAAHDTACVGCHILPKDEKGLTLRIHSNVPPKGASICADCHRKGTSELEKNTIFTVQVNNDPNEPPDYNYQAELFLYGTCTKCHGNKLNMGNNGEKGCLPCHFQDPGKSWPTDANSFVGSKTWGHNFQKRNNEDKQVSKPRK